MVTLALALPAVSKRSIFHRQVSNHFSLPYPTRPPVTLKHSCLLFCLETNPTSPTQASVCPLLASPPLASQPISRVAALRQCIQQEEVPRSSSCPCHAHPAFWTHAYSSVLENRAMACRSLWHPGEDVGVGEFPPAHSDPPEGTSDLTHPQTP